MRRGAALILVLGLLAMVSAALVAWMHAAAGLSETWILRDREAHLLAQERALERLTLDWLTLQGGRLVAPPEGGTWTILANSWSTADHRGWVVVTIHDAWSGIPPHLAGPRGELRRFLPFGLAGLDFPGQPVANGGIAPVDLLDRWDLPAGIRRFPSMAHDPSGQGPRWCFGDGVSLIPGVPPGIQYAPGGQSSAAEIFSPHSDGRININTAPLPLIEHVLRLQGGLALPDLRRNREAGILSQPPNAPGGGGGRCILTGSTGAWNAQITLAIDGMKRSWWVVVVGSGGPPRILQRHAIEP